MEPAHTFSNENLPLASVRPFSCGCSLFAARMTKLSADYRLVVGIEHDAGDALVGYRQLETSQIDALTAGVFGGQIALAPAKTLGGNRDAVVLRARQGLNFKAPLRIGAGWRAEGHAHIPSVEGQSGCAVGKRLALRIRDAARQHQAGFQAQGDVRGVRVHRLATARFRVTSRAM